jgi:hypothetical protein
MRYRVEMVTQDAEPSPIACPIDYVETLDDARQVIAYWQGDGPTGCYFAVYDMDRAVYIEN